MKLKVKYVIYELISNLTHDCLDNMLEQKVLEEVKFIDSKTNSFDSEEEAMQALIDDRSYKNSCINFVILKEVYFS